MSPLSDDDVARLAGLVELPEIPGGRYRAERRLGRGGMGTVFLAHDLALDRRVAVKVLHPQRGASELAARLEREARTIAALDHPSIVAIHDVGRLDDGRPYYVMKHVAGRTLREWRRSGPTIQEGLRTFLRLCEAVAHAHALGVIHRDLKPDNVMAGAHGELYVMDWGLAKAAEERDEDAGARAADGIETEHGAALGTPGYRAPEQRGGASLAPAADVHALGGILAFVLRGDDPPEGGAIDLEGSPRPLASIVARCRAADPGARYPSARELAADIARYLDREPVSAHRETLVERAGRFLDRHKFLVWLIVGYLVLRLLVQIATAD